MPMNGSDVLLYAEDAPGSGNLINIGHQRDVTFNDNSDTINMSSKESRAQRVDYGRYSSDVSLDHLYVPSDTAMRALKQSIRQGIKIKVQAYENGVPVEEATCVVTGNSKSFPDQGEATVSVSLTVDGEWTVL